MEGIPAKYLGRIVSKDNFRVFIYGANGESKLVESWESFEMHMATGIWFATVHEAEIAKEMDEESKKEVKDTKTKRKE